MAVHCQLKWCGYCLRWIYLCQLVIYIHICRQFLLACKSLNCCNLSHVTLGFNFIWTTRIYAMAFPHYIAVYWIDLGPYKTLCCEGSSKLALNSQANYIVSRLPPSPHASATPTYCFIIRNTSLVRAARQFGRVECTFRSCLFFVEVGDGK